MPLWGLEACCPGNPKGGMSGARSQWQWPWCPPRDICSVTISLLCEDRAFVVWREVWWDEVEQGCAGCGTEAIGFCSPQVWQKQRQKDHFNFQTCFFSAQKFKSPCKRGTLQPLLAGPRHSWWALVRKHQPATAPILVVQIWQVIPWVTLAGQCPRSKSRLPAATENPRLPFAGRFGLTPASGFTCVTSKRLQQTKDLIQQLMPTCESTHTGQWLEGKSCLDSSPTSVTQWRMLWRSCPWRPEGDVARWLFPPLQNLAVPEPPPGAWASVLSPKIINTWAWDESSKPLKCYWLPY